MQRSIKLNRPLNMLLRLWNCVIWQFWCVCEGKAQFGQISHKVVRVLNPYVLEVNSWHDDSFIGFFLVKVGWECNFKGLRGPLDDEENPFINLTTLVVLELGREFLSDGLALRVELGRSLSGLARLGVSETLTQVAILYHDFTSLKFVVPKLVKVELTGCCLDLRDLDLCLMPVIVEIEVEHLTVLLMKVSLWKDFFKRFSSVGVSDGLMRNVMNGERLVSFRLFELDLSRHMTVFLSKHLIIVEEMIELTVLLLTLKLWRFEPWSISWFSDLMVVLRWATCSDNNCVSHFYIFQ